jgi:plasmid stability protein
MKKHARGRRVARARTRSERSTAVRYTVRDVPPDVDRALRHRAKEEGKSLHEVLRQALVREAGRYSLPVLHHDVDALAGTWDDDPEFDRALAEQDRVDEVATGDGRSAVADLLRSRR